MELLIKVFNKNVDLIKQRGFNAQTSAAIEKYCACKGLVPSKYWELKLKKTLTMELNFFSFKDTNCIVKGECKPFQICI